MCGACVVRVWCVSLCVSSPLGVVSDNSGITALERGPALSQTVSVSDCPDCQFPDSLLQ